MYVCFVGLLAIVKLCQNLNKKLIIKHHCEWQYYVLEGDSGCDGEVVAFVAVYSV